MKKKNLDKSVNVRMNHELYEKAEAIANEKSTSVSTVIRIIMIRFFEEKENNNLL